jgi:hypothetical protein
MGRMGRMGRDGGQRIMILALVGAALAFAAAMALLVVPAAAFGR